MKPTARKMIRVWPMTQNNTTDIHLIRRTLVPLLIITLPIAAMVTYVLYSKQAHRPAGPDLSAVLEATLFWG